MYTFFTRIKFTNRELPYYNDTSEVWIWQIYLYWILIEFWLNPVGIAPRFTAKLHTSWSTSDYPIPST